MAAKLKLTKKSPELIEELMADRLARRKQTQPLDKPSAGSVFRNPEGNYAGALIEESDLKGYSIGGAEVSTKHANFIINTGDATGEDIVKLIKKIQREIKKKYNIDLLLEQIIIK